MLEIKNVGMVFCASFNERLSKEMLLRSNVLQFLLCWWSHGDISFFPLIVIFFLIFHWFISSSLSEKSGIFVTTLISLFSPQTLQSLLWHVLIHRHNWVKPQEYGKSEIYTETRELTFHLQSCLNFQIYWTVFSIDLEITAADSAGKSHGFCGGKCL